MQKKKNIETTNNEKTKTVKTAKNVKLPRVLMLGLKLGKEFYKILHKKYFHFWTEYKELDM